MSTPRESLEAILTPLIPSDWRIVPDERTTDVPSKTVVTFKLKRIIRTPGSPLASHDVEFTVTITSRLADWGKAEDELDDTVVALLHALDVAGIPWTEATKVLDKDRMGYDISITLTSKKENT